MLLFYKLSISVIDKDNYVNGRNNLVDNNKIGGRNATMYVPGNQLLLSEIRGLYWKRLIFQDSPN